MMPPMMRGRKMPAKLFRTFFLMFVIRHAFGVALFAWILAAAGQTDNKAYVWVLAVGLAVYAATAVYNGKKAWGLYQRRLVEEAEERAAAASMTVQEVDA